MQADEVEGVVEEGECCACTRGEEVRERGGGGGGVVAGGIKDSKGGEEKQK
ncbi:hypothetical protein FACS189472_09470 [Alphaproteobacteria bacterium]|nr:hypothetical protein FACS189472_09470 [Alphaproteobacteria bacterium]